MNTPSLLSFIFDGPLGPIIAGIWGALWGSFFNVVIVRVPRDLSVVLPSSFCHACKNPLRWYDNIPIVSYLVLRGRCRHCGTRYSPRYLFVEALIAALSLACFVVFVRHGDADLGLRVARFVITSLFCGLLVAIAFIDLDTMLIPNVITFPTIPLAIVLSLFMPLPHAWDGLLGAIGGYLGIRIIADGYQLITGRAGMGYGDAKLLALIGGLLGWQVLVFVLFLASFQGSLIGISFLLWQRRRSRHAAESSDETNLRHVQLPFGPYLSLAAIEILLLRDILDPWLALFPGVR